ncbi:hypothetical protein Rumeso_00796 [Rubellimicrobium mesophilum DSM 19309]|uniref:DUF3572 domain-containing protein n=1 Tax=Rubellimicrobium mesophilum DSM 19309 TaxID=442562 RepID=A0A017HTI4_9RHOB|nr:DUF3572 domain-containing protein [Rubellimicrobium mesophilum]EYD77630.1 hypothetical protein Rumeso_00796 [Rubellimicrobium mesophilum DSM 19309]
MNLDRAETIALQALAWIAADEELLPQLAGATGMSLGDAKERAQDPAFLAGILEFLCMEDRWIQRFCDEHGLPYDAPMKALMALPGQQRGEWP